MGVQPEILNARPGCAVDPNAVEDRLRADRAHEIKAVLVVQVDTASSVWNDIAAIRKAIDAAGHPALYMVDVIASQGCMRYEMDAWGVDVTVGGAQKGLMTPPGLAFCWANERAMAAEKKADLRTDYWSWAARSGGQQYQNFAGTAPVHHLFALREALNMLAEEGMESVWARHAALARAVHAAVEAWTAEGPLEFFVADPAQRADSVTTILAEGCDPEGMRAFIHREMGVVLGTALGDLSGRAFRIGHMGWLNAPMVMGTLGAAEAALRARDVAIGEGALGAAAQALADHFAGRATAAAA
jgi:alanine-glyoxylate transaminase/serine-glyoxylate transaminase/serine-pyruvate transaminase